MKRLAVLAVAVFSLVAAESFAQGTVRRDGYVTRNGTYVPPSYATRPDGNPHNNFSTRGNVNPYTGRPGTVDPYAQPRNSYSTNPYGSTNRRPY